MISPLQLINTGSVPNDGTGDSLKVGAGKTNQNFQSVSSSLSEISSSIQILSSSIELKLNKNDLIAGTGIIINSSSGQYIISSSNANQQSFDIRDVYLFS